MPETHSPRVLLGGEAGLGARRPSAPRPQPCPLSQLGRSAPRPRRTDGPKRASGSCIVQRESLLGQPTTAPTRLGSGKQRKPFSPPALRSPEGKAGRGCPWLPGPCCFAGGLRCPKPTPDGFSFAGKQDCAREGLLGPGRSHESLACSAAQRRGPVAPTAQNELLAAAFCKAKVSSGSKPQPQRASNPESNASLFRPRPHALHRAKRVELPLAPWALLLCWGSPAAQTQSPRVLLCGEARLGARRPSAPRPQLGTLSQLGRSAPRPRHTDGPKQSSGSCILQRETLLGPQTTAPTRLGTRKQRKPFSPPAPRSP